MSDIHQVAAPGKCLDDCVSKGHDYSPTLHKTQQDCSATSACGGSMGYEIQVALRISRVTSAEPVTW